MPTPNVYRPAQLLALLTTGLILACGGGGGGTSPEPPPPPPAMIWQSMAPAPTGSRGPVAFAVNGAAYVVTGSGTLDVDPNSKVWKFEPATNTWTVRRPFPGMASLDGLAFAVGGKGYVVFGHNNSTTNLVRSRECWEYEPTTDTWTRKGDFPGSGRSGVSSVVVGQKAYCYSGSDLNWQQPLKELWVYEPATDTWTRKADGPEGSFLPSAFGIGTKAYFMMGDRSHWAFLEYDTSTDTWTRRKSFPGTAGWGALGLALGSKGYLCSGAKAVNPQVDCQEVWEYDPATDAWTRKPDTEAPGRVMAVGFVLDSHLYIGLGAGITSRNHADLWRWRPGQ